MIGFFLAPSHQTLAAVLKKTGFQTGAVVGAYVLDGKWGLNQGFDTYVDDFDLTKMTGGVGIGAVKRTGIDASWTRGAVQTYIHTSREHRAGLRRIG